MTLRQLFLDRKLPVVVAVACMTATSAGCLQNPDMNGAKPEWALLHDSRDGSGALWLGFPHGLEGQVLVRAENVTGFPFSIQVSWIPQAGTPEPMFFGYEMDFPHQEGAASVGVGGTTVDSPPLGEGLDPFAAGANLNVTRPGPGHLVVAWSELPQGIKVWLDGHAEPPTETVLLDAELVRVTGDTDGPQAYTAILQAASGTGHSALRLPHLVSLRLILPTNAGQGRVAVSGPAVDWERRAPDGGVNTSCIDCFEIRRYVAVLDQEWAFEVAYVGSSANFQAYLAVIEMPASVVVGAPNQFVEHLDCETAFAGCGL